MWEEIQTIEEEKGEELLRAAKNELREVQQNISPLEEKASKDENSQIFYGVVREPAITPQEEKLLKELKTREITLKKKTTELKNIPSGKNELRKKLGNLKPYAIISKNLFNAVINKYGLYQFRNLGKTGETGTSSRVMAILDFFTGIVALSPGWIINTLLLSLLYALSPEWGLIYAGVSLVGLMFTIQGLRLWESSKDLHGTLLITLGTSALTGFPLYIRGVEELVLIWIATYIGTVVVEVFLTAATAGILGAITGKVGEFKKPVVKAGFKLLMLLPNSLLLRLFFPEKHDYPIGEDNLYANIYFLGTDQKFIKILKSLKEKGLTPRFAVQKEAIRINKNATKVLNAEKIEKRKFDPILYVEMGNVVAILHQSGNFADEKKVIEWVKSRFAQIYLEN